MTIPGLQIGSSGASLQKKLPQFWLLPNISEFIVNSPNQCFRCNGEVCFGSRCSQFLQILQICVEVLNQLWSLMARDKNLPELWYHVRIFLREQFTQDQGAQSKAHSRPKIMINMIMITIIISMSKHVHTH